MSQEFITCAATDPNRCQSSDQNGSQCGYLAVEGYKFCPRHNAKTAQSAAKRAAGMYDLGVYQSVVEKFATHDEIKNLRGEVGILRMTLQSILKQCGGDANKLIGYSGKIADIVIKVKDLLRTCHAIDKDMGMLMDRDKVMLIGQSIVNIICEYVTDPEKVDELSQKIALTIFDISKSD